MSLTKWIGGSGDEDGNGPASLRTRAAFDLCGHCTSSRRTTEKSPRIHILRTDIGHSQDFLRGGTGGGGAGGVKGRLM